MTTLTPPTWSSWHSPTSPGRASPRSPTTCTRPSRTSWPPSKPTSRAGRDRGRRAARRPPARAGPSPGGSRLAGSGKRAVGRPTGTAALPTRRSSTTGGRRCGAASRRSWPPGGATTRTAGPPRCRGVMTTEAPGWTVGDAIAVTREAIEFARTKPGPYGVPVNIDEAARRPARARRAGGRGGQGQPRRPPARQAPAGRNRRRRLAGVTAGLRHRVPGRGRHRFRQQ